MIRSLPVSSAYRPGYRRRMGAGVSTAAGTALGLSSLTTAGIGAATSLASSALLGWMNSIQISHNADTATTLIVNGLGTQLSNLVSAYLADPPSCASQRAALDAYDQAWAWLQSPAACGDPNFGAAGNRCISDRAPTGKTPWQTYYRDPIANDPRLAGAGCDTSQEVILPSLSTGTYSPTGITAGGGIDTTVTGTAAAGGSSTTTAATTTTAAATSSTSVWLIAAALGLGALLYFK